MFAVVEWSDFKRLLRSNIDVHETSQPALTKLTASTMLHNCSLLVAAIERQYSSVLPLLHVSLPVFDKSLWNGN